MTCDNMTWTYCHKTVSQYIQTLSRHDWHLLLHNCRRMGNIWDVVGNSDLYKILAPSPQSTYHTLSKGLSAKKDDAFLASESLIKQIPRILGPQQGWQVPLAAHTQRTSAPRWTRSNPPSSFRWRRHMGTRHHPPHVQNLYSSPWSVLSSLSLMGLKHWIGVNIG